MSSRVLLIGLDGADPALIGRWIAEKRLPNLAALAAQGSFLPIRSTLPPATFPAWTTCVTGVNPGRHGIFDFTQLAPDGNGLQFLNATFRRTPAVWNLLSAEHARVAVLGVPATWPPEPVNGIMVSGFDSPLCGAMDSSFVYPRTRFGEFKNWQYAVVDEIHTGPGWHANALHPLREKIRAKADIATRLAASEPWDFMMVVFGESDFAGHHYWMYHDPHSPWFREGEPALRDALANVYEMLDTAVGRIMDAFGDGVTLLVSDHGMGPASDTVIHLNNWLDREGFLSFTPNAGGGWLKRAALASVPRQWRGSLFRRFPSMAGRAEAASRLGGIDRPRSAAWSEELNYAPSVRMWDPAKRDELYARLSAWEMVGRAVAREEAYAGPYTEHAPDFLLQWRDIDGCIPLCLRARGGDAVRRLSRDEMWGAKERGTSGMHRSPGSLLSSRPVSKPDPGLEDITPTVLALTGCPAPDMDGRPLWGESAVPRLESQSANIPPQMEYTETEANALEARLRSLGYFE